MVEQLRMEFCDIQKEKHLQTNGLSRLVQPRTPRLTILSDLLYRMNVRAMRSLFSRTVVNTYVHFLDVFFSCRRFLVTDHPDARIAD